MSYELKLIDKRLSEMVKEYALINKVINEKTDDYFEAIRLFNKCRDVSQKMKLAKHIKKLHNKMMTWTQRLDTAYDKKLALDLEHNDLSMRKSIINIHQNRFTKHNEVQGE